MALYSGTLVCKCFYSENVWLSVRRVWQNFVFVFKLCTGDKQDHSYLSQMNINVAIFPKTINQGTTIFCYCYVCSIKDHRAGLRHDAMPFLLLSLALVHHHHVFHLCLHIDITKTNTRTINWTTFTISQGHRRAKNQGLLSLHLCLLRTLSKVFKHICIFIVPFIDISTV